MDGGSLAGPLFIVFLVLKLTHTITWSWWWVTAPLWGDLATTLVLLALIGLGFISGFAFLKGSRRVNRRRYARR